MQMRKKFSVEPEYNLKRISVIMGDKNTFRHPRARIMVDLYFFHNKKVILLQGGEGVIVNQNMRTNYKVHFKIWIFLAILMKGSSV